LSEKSNNGMQNLVICSAFKSVFSQFYYMTNICSCQVKLLQKSKQIDTKVNA
jgi:hypothetical protein